MKLQWVNHASLVVEHGDARLISDPWLEGRVFADSWELLSESTFTAEDFASVSHIWFSHEHADHFCPPNLRKIPAEVRANLPVMIQKTSDRKVVDWSLEHGFRDVRELPAGEWVELSPDVRVLCQPARFDDSWLAVEAGGELLLNLNDCILDTEERMQQVMEQLGRRVDVLLLQFSYSARVANPGDDDALRREADRILDTIAMMTRIADPSYVIPFASYIWFCHEENAYMNAGLVTPLRAYDRIREATRATPVVMYPGDTWAVGDRFDSESAIERYALDIDTVSRGDRPLVRAPLHEFPTLVARAQRFRKRLLGSHGLPLKLVARLGLLNPMTLYITDLNVAAAFSLSRGLEPTGKAREDCDIALSSDALSYVFEHLWGGETLKINGRFEVPPRGRFHAFDRYVTLGELANHRESYLRHRARRSLLDVAQRLPGRFFPQATTSA